MGSLRLFKAFPGHPLNVPHLLLKIFGSGVLQVGQLSLIVRHALLKTPRIGSLQGSKHTLRLASACVLQDAQVALMRHLLWWPIRPLLASGCLSSRGPFGLALSFYHVQVWRLDVTHFDFKYELGSTNYSRSILPLHPPCFVRVLGNSVRRLQACQGNMPQCRCRGT